MQSVRIVQPSIAGRRCYSIGILLATTTFALACAACDRGVAPVALQSRPDLSREKRVAFAGHVYAQVKNEQSDELRHQPVAEATVYLEPSEGIDATPPETPATLRARGGRLEPNYSCLLLGQKLVIEFAEEGEYLIRVYGKGEPESGDLRPPNPRAFETIFTKAHPSANIVCAAHAGLKGAVTVVPNLAFTRTRANGSFDLEYPLPPGTYQVSAFYPKFGKARREVVIRADGPPQTVDFVLPLVE